MLARLWFALSLLWAATLLLLCLNPNANNLGREYLALIAVVPFALGLLVRRVTRYVVTGR